MAQESAQVAGRSRRQFLSDAARWAGVAAVAGSPPGWGAFGNHADEKPSRTLKRVAAISTVYRPQSHAYHIAGRFVHGYPKDGFHHQPPFKLVRMYNDQYPPDDKSRDVAKRHGIEICSTIAETLGGPAGLDVDGVLLIGEHGTYPVNSLGQILYPRHRWFMEMADVFRKSKRTAPVFCDKHLSYDHLKAAEMVRVAQELGFGFMAGSSLPVTWRRPSIEPELGTPLVEALVCHHGGVEVYGFHGLETLQCIMERRSRQETGVSAVTCLEGQAVWEAGDRGLWSKDLLEAALERCPTRDIGDMRINSTRPIAILVEYRNGARGAVLNLSGHVADITLAARIRGRKQPISALFCLPGPPGAHFFDPLVFNIEKLFSTGTPPYPVERTLLTTTVLDFAMGSLQAGGKRMEDATLHVSYRTPEDSGFFRGSYPGAE